MIANCADWPRQCGIVALSKECKDARTAAKQKGQLQQLLTNRNNASVTGASEIYSSCEAEMYSSKSKATCANELQEKYTEQSQSLCRELFVSKEIIAALKEE